MYTPTRQDRRRRKERRQSRIAKQSKKQILVLMAPAQHFRHWLQTDAAQYDGIENDTAVSHTEKVLRASPLAKEINKQWDRQWREPFVGITTEGREEVSQYRRNSGYVLNIYCQKLIIYGGRTHREGHAQFVSCCRRRHSHWRHCECR